MSERILYVAALIALTVAACSSAEQGSPVAADSSTTSVSSTTNTPAGTTTTVPAGPVADILNARQVQADGYHDMSFGGETPESMTKTKAIAFLTPSANIACVWSPGSETGQTTMTCSARERTSPPPARPADCQNAWATSYVRLGSDGRVDDGVCTGGVQVPSIANVLPYDSALVAGDFGCLSAEAGVTCAHIPSGRGFTLSREKLTTF